MKNLKKKTEKRLGVTGKMAEKDADTCRHGEGEEDGKRSEEGEQKDIVEETEKKKRERPPKKIVKAEGKETGGIKNLIYNKEFNL